MMPVAEGLLPTGSVRQPKHAPHRNQSATNASPVDEPLANGQRALGHMRTQDSVMATKRDPSTESLVVPAAVGISPPAGLRDRNTLSRHRT